MWKNYSYIKKIKAIVVAICAYTCFLNNAFAQSLPTAITDLEFWICADSINQSDGSKVETWTAINNEFLFVTQTEEERRPILTKNALNGHSVIRFDGSDDYFDGGVDLGNIDDNGATILIVGISHKAPGTYLAKSYAGGVNNRYAIIYEPHIFFVFQDITNNHIEAPTHTYGNYECITTTIDIPSSKNSLYIDGKNFGETHTTGSSMFSTWNFLIGAYNNNQGTIPPVDDYYLNGDIAEIIIYDRALSQLERQDIENYLRLKYFPTEYRPPLDLTETITETSLAPVNLAFTNHSYYVSYEWNTGETTPNITVDKSGEYSVIVHDDRGYVYYDTVQVSMPDMHNINDTIICRGESITWDCDLNSPSYSYKWQPNGETTKSITITESGKYWVEVSDGTNKKYSDTVTVFVDDFATEATLGPDVAMCEGNPLYLKNRKEDAVLYEWSTGYQDDNKDIIYPKTTGKYSVKATNKIGCVANDEINITINGLAPSVFIEAKDLCINETANFKSKSFTTDESLITSYAWTIDGKSFNINNVQYKYSDDGFKNVSLVVETSAGCSNKKDTIIEISPLPTAVVFPPKSCSKSPTLFTNKGTVSNGHFIENSQWSIDGKPMFGNEIEFTFEDSKYYDIYLKSITNKGCENDTTVTIEVLDAVSVDFVYNSSCENQATYIFDKTDNTKPQHFPLHSAPETMWIVDSIAYKYTSMLPQIFTDTKDKIVTLQIKTINGCVNRKTDTIKVNQQPLMNLPEIYGCNNEPIELYDVSNTHGDSITEYVWQIDSFGIVYDAKPYVMYPEAGDYSYSLKITTEHACYSEATSSIHVQPPPIANFEFTPSFGAIPLVVDFTNTSIGAETYKWRFEYDSISTEENPTHEFTYIDTSYATLWAYSSYGCVASVTKHIPTDLANQRIKILDLNFSKDERGFIIYNFTVANIGNTPIKLIEFVIDNPDQPLTSEIWEGELEVGKSLSYILRGRPHTVGDETPAFLCVTANLIPPENQNYLIYDSDTLCKTFENEHKIFSIAPNPVIDDVTITFTTKTKGNVTLECIDTKGKIVLSYNYEELKAGYHFEKINLEPLQSGVYILRLKQGGNVTTESFLKTGNPN